MKRLTKTLLASAAVLALAMSPVLAAGPGKSDCPGGGPAYSQQMSQKTMTALKLNDKQKAAYDNYINVSTAEREERWKVRDAIDPAVIQKMTAEEFRQHQTDMSKARIESMTKVFEARQAFVNSLSAEQQKTLGDNFGFGPMGGRHPRWGGPSQQQ